MDELIIGQLHQNLVLDCQDHLEKSCRLIFFFKPDSCDDIFICYDFSGQMFKSRSLLFIHLSKHFKAPWYTVVVGLNPRYLLRTNLISLQTKNHAILRFAH